MDLILSLTMLLNLLKEIKTLKPHIPVIMITKNEEEWLMDEIISEKTAGYLTKPVNPSQIFSECKKILEEDYLFENKNTNLYLKNKGMAEEELRELNFKKFIIIRPSFLIGKRIEERLGEKIGLAILQRLF